MISPFSAKEVKDTIVYLYLLSFLSTDRMDDFKQSVFPIYRGTVQKGNPKKQPSIEKILPDACYRIAAFHQAKREPDTELVKSFLKVALPADQNTKSLRAFKEQMDLLFTLPGRAKMENRLHRNKGCRYCAFPCHYGFFTLVSDPDFSRLQEFLSAEARKPGQTQTPLLPVYLFTIEHLMNLTVPQIPFFDKEQVANLAFCLLLLGLAKSRLAFPEAQIKLFQEANQQFILR
jgi:hypothetical protein